MSGKLNQYLHDCDVECEEMKGLLIKEMAEREGVTDRLKAEEQIKWVGMMNNIRQRAEEVVVLDLVLV